MFEQLDRDMEQRVASLTRLIKTLPKNRQTKRLDRLYHPVSVPHQARCNLFFLARQGELLPGDELELYLDELAELARYAGLQTLIRCGQKERWRSEARRSVTTMPLKPYPGL